MNLNTIIVYKLTAGMILGVSSFAYGWAAGELNQPSERPMNAFDLIGIAAGFELSCLQIGDNLPLHLLDEGERQALKSAAEKNFIRLEIGARGLTRKNLMEYLLIAQSVHAPLLRFVIDGPDHEPPIHEVTALLKDFLPEVKKANLTLGIENHDRFKVKDLARMLDDIGSDAIGICLDCVNSMGAGEGLEYVVDILAPYTVNLHIKDFTVTRLPHKMGFTITGTQPGRGMMNLPVLMEKLAPFNRCQSAVLEQWVPWQNDLMTTIQTEKDWASEGIHYLRSLPYFKTK